MRKLSQRTGWVVIFALTTCCSVSCGPSNSAPREIAETTRPSSGTSAAPAPGAPKGTRTTAISPASTSAKTPNPATQNIPSSNGVAGDSKNSVPNVIGSRRPGSVGERQALDEANPGASDNERAPNVPARANPPNTLPSGRANSRSTSSSEPEISIADLLKVTPSGEEGLSPGDIVPEISGKDMETQPMRMSDYRGQVVMLDFWGDW